MQMVDPYLILWITCIDLAAHLRASLGLGQSLAVGGPILLPLFLKAHRPIKTTLTASKTLLPQTSVTSYKWRVPLFAVKVILTTAPLPPLRAYMARLPSTTITTSVITTTTITTTNLVTKVSARARATSTATSSAPAKVVAQPLIPVSPPCFAMKEKEHARSTRDLPIRAAAAIHKSRAHSPSKRCPSWPSWSAQCLSAGKRAHHLPLEEAVVAIEVADPSPNRPFMKH